MAGCSGEIFWELSPIRPVDILIDTDCDANNVSI
jgi:hypothetical protein